MSHARMLLRILLLLACPGVLHAQEGLRVIQCRIASYHPVPGGAPLLYSGPLDASVELPLTPSIPARSVGVPSNGREIEFRDQAEGSEIVAVAKLPPNASRVLILFFPDKQSGKFQTYVIPDDERSLPAGGCLVLNLCSHDVRFFVGEHRFLLRPGKSAAIPIPKERNDFNMSRVAFHFPQGEAWRRGFESVIKFTGSTRRILVTSNDLRSTRPQFKIFRVSPEL